MKKSVKTIGILLLFVLAVALLALDLIVNNMGFRI